MATNHTETYRVYVLAPREGGGTVSVPWITRPDNLGPRLLVERRANDLNRSMADVPGVSFHTRKIDTGAAWKAKAEAAFLSAAGMTPVDED